MAPSGRPPDLREAQNQRKLHLLSRKEDKLLLEEIAKLLGRYRS
jgi:hypothetical protein